MLNDLTATAQAVPLLGHREFKALNKKRAHKSRNIGLIAPGTGLGLSLLVYAHGRYHPVDSEGGHANFAPSEPLEKDLWQFLHARYGHVSKERVLSGQGLINIYDWLKARGDIAPSPKIERTIRASNAARVISENAISGRDRLCRAALRRFCRIFGSIAGDLALTGMATGGVYLGGGISPKILPILQGPEFMEAFVDKGRFEGFMQKIAVKVILNDKAALLGAAHCALELSPE